MNILIWQNEAEPSWITKLLFVIRNYHLSGNHSNTKSVQDMFCRENAMVCNQRYSSVLFVCFMKMCELHLYQ
jgi:hypothetical protein